MNCLFESEIEQITLDILHEENGYSISVTKVLEQAELLADYWTS
jgi:hypothetical protein